MPHWRPIVIGPYLIPVAIVGFTGVMSRYVVGIGGIVLAALGLSPKIGALVTTNPSAVSGGAVLHTAGMIAASGTRLIFSQTDRNRRNMVIIAVALRPGFGVSTRLGALAGPPEAAETFFG
ncbi:MAG: solute carrier family 23 protein [Natronomonas sp.]